MSFRYLIDTIGLPEKKVFMIPLWNFIDSGNYFHARYRYVEKGNGELQLPKAKCKRKLIPTVLPDPKLKPTTCEIKPKFCVQSTSTAACPQSEIVFFAQNFDVESETKESDRKLVDPKTLCLKFHKNIEGKVGCFSRGEWFGGYLSSLLSSTSIVILLGFLQPVHESHHVDMLLYHGLVVVSTHSLGPLFLFSPLLN
jgi:hypothetical protein